MTLADISIRNPVFAWITMSALILFGLISYQRMGVSQLPDVDFPYVTITLSWEGASPEVMETDVVDVVESAVMSIQGVNNVTSSMQLGSATVTIEFNLNRNIDAAVQDVQNQIAQAQRTLPPNLDPPIISKVNPEDQPIVWLTVTGAGSLRNLMTYVQNVLRDQFTTVEGVGDIIMGGFVDRNLRIWVDREKLQSLQLTVDDVITAVQQQHREVPAGSIETPRTEMNVRVMGEATTPEEFGNLLIQRRAGGPVFTPIHIRDVATVTDSLADIRRIARANGEIAVGLGIRKQRGANEVAVAKAALARLDQIRGGIPKDIKVDVAFNRTTFIEDSIRELTFTLLLSALVTSLVCWIFLGSWSATLNILLAIPTSILGSFIVLNIFGFTLNTFTVLGLTLAVGIVVDDAIMVLENIVRYRENGFGRVRAARVGARQITFAALATTLALIAIFLPVAFMYGIIGKFFFQYGVTISVAVALSLFEALTLTPMRSSQFLQVKPRTSRFGRAVSGGFRRLADRYRRSLGWVLDHRGLVLLATLAIFVVSLLFVGLLRKELMPAQDQSMLLVRLQTPPGSSIEYTSKQFALAERIILNRPEVERYFGIIGGFSGGEVNSGFVFATLKKPGDRPIAAPFTHRPSQTELMGYFRERLNRVPDVRAVVQDLSQAGFAGQRGFPIEFTVQGPEWSELAAISGEMQKEMARSGLMTDVDTDYLPNVPEVHVYPDRVKAEARAVDVQTIGNTINALVGGEPIGQFTEGGHRYDIRIRLIPSERSLPDQINQLQVWNNRGELVQLRDVVTIKEVPTSPVITRRDRERAISIFANVAPGKSQTDALAEVNRMAARILPHDYHIVFTGSAETFRQSFLSLLYVLFLGIIVSYMVLGSQFNSYIHPIIILLALPFSVTGALIALWVGGQSLNIYSFIGIILLMGIVKKNSILLVDFTNQMRRQGRDVREALIEACPIRLRPILMTSAATIAAALPPAMALGPGAEVRVPMAIAVIGGVIFSTLLTLFAVPSAYSLFSRIERQRYVKPEDEGGEDEGPAPPNPPPEPEEPAGKGKTGE